MDILIDYDKAPSLVTLIEIENMLRDLLGIKVDFFDQQGIETRFSQRILDEVVYL